MRRLPVFQLLLVAALVFAGGAAFLGVFTAADLLPWLAGAALVPPLLSLVIRSNWRPHLAMATLVNLVVFVVFLSVSLFRESTVAAVVPTVRTFSLIVDGVRNGWAEILSSTVPAPPRPISLFVPVALTWIAAFVSAEMICRTRRVFLVLLPAVVVGAAGMLFGLQSSQTSYAAMTLVVALAAVLLAVRSSALAGDPRPFDQREDDRAQDPNAPESEVSWALWRQRMLIAVPFVIVVVLLAPPIARSLPFVDANRQVLLRDRYVVPVERSQDLNPLTGVAAADGGTTIRYRVTTDAAVSGTPRFATTVLDRFDGAQWRNATEYVTVGERLPTATDTPDRTKTVRQDFEVVKPDGPWLPAMSRVAGVEAPTDVRVQADPSTGALLTSGSAASFRYGVTSEVADYRVDEIVSAGVATIDSARAAVAKTDQLPPELLTVRDEVMGPATSPFGQLARLLAFFHNDERVNRAPAQFKVDDEASSGFTLAEIAQFLKADGARAGRPELYAATFATLARSQGFPARIVVGYVPPEPIVPGTPVELRDGDLTAWAEVALAGFGWVPFDPSPNDAATSKSTVEEEQLDTLVNQSVDNSINNPEQRPGENPNATQAPPPEPESSTGRLLAVLGVVGLVVVMAMLLVLGPWWRKRRRAARRRSDPDPAARVAGAWLEAMDRLGESDVSAPVMLTTDQAAAVADERFGPDHTAPLHDLGPLVNRALHAADPPADEVATEAWALSDAFAAEVRKTQSRPDRLRASLDRRPLADANNGGG